MDVSKPPINGVAKPAKKRISKIGCNLEAVVPIKGLKMGLEGKKPIKAKIRDFGKFDLKTMS
jgi:hypothetical protein